MRGRKHGDEWLRRFVPYLLYTTTNRLNRRLRGTLRTQGINIGRWRVLAVLRAFGELNVGRIVDLAVMEQPTVSRILVQLEREALVDRRTSTLDSREVLVSLTAAGNEAFEAIYPTADKHQQRALEGFSRKEVDALVGYLHRIQANIDRQI
jgi:DNA-binding MarR family transcriptional regulator